MRLAALLGSRTLRGNTIANLVGRIVPGLLTVAAVPVLVRLLGPEAYGVVGLFAVLQIVLTTLDVGLTTTATREIALDVAQGRPDAERWTLVRTLEVPYWLFGVFAACLLAAASGWVASNWLNVHSLPTSEVRLAFAFGGIALGVRWPVSLYRGILDGLQLQVKENAITVAAAAVRVLGGLVVVVAVSRSITAYMAWQVFGSGLEVLTMRYAVLGGLPRGERGARFATAIIRRVWRFALALNAVSVLAIVLTQVDRVVISKRLPLTQLGYYTVAVTAAGIVPNIAAAVSAAVLPRFAGKLGVAETDDLRRTYGQASHVVAFTAAATSLPLALFSPEILRLWTGSDRVADVAGTPLRLLAVAYLLNALYAIPYTLAIARGYTRIALLVNAVDAPVVAAAMYVLVPRWGITGAAAIWLATMGVNFAVYVVSVHRLVLRQEWLAIVRGIVPYLVLGGVVFGAARVVASAADQQLISYAIAAGAFIVYVAAGVRILPVDLRVPRPVVLPALRVSRRPHR